MTGQTAMPFDVFLATRDLGCLRLPSSLERLCVFVF